MEKGSNILRGLKLGALVFLLQLFAGQSSHAANYYSIAAGSWTTCASWIPGCPPNPIPAGDTVFVLHTISLTANLTINGVLNVKPAGILWGAKNITANAGGTIINEGNIATGKNVDVKGAYLGTGKMGIDDLEVSGSMLFSGEITQTGDVDISGSVTYTSGFWSADKFDVDPGATVNNQGRMTLAGQLKIEGVVNNTNYISAFKVHLDGELCNSDTVVVDPGEKLDLHGGWVHCGGFMEVCEIKIHENGAQQALLEEQNICCGGSEPTIDFEEGTIDSSTVSWCGTALRPSPLPVEMLRFAAEQVDQVVVVSWTTATEIDNDRFEIERSDESGIWEYLGFVTGYGTTTESNNYEFADASPMAGTNYYRLRQMDFNGVSETFGPLAVSISNDRLEEKLIRPVIAGNNLRFQLEISNLDSYEVNLYDLGGRLLLTETIAFDFGLQQYSFNFNNASSSIYILEVKTQNERITKKIARQ